MIESSPSQVPDGTIGVLGGMGPAATSRFFDLLIERTPADTDQDHLRIVVDNNPKTPDRAEFLIGSGDDPRPFLIGGAKNIEELGADILTIPCNTAHAFIEDIDRLSTIRVLDMIKITSKEHVK